MNTVLDVPLPETGASAAGADGSGYVNISQAAALLGVSRVSVWRWIRAGQLPAARLGHRTTRIQRDDLEKLLLRNRAVGSLSRVIEQQDRRAAALAEDGAAFERAPGSGWTDVGAGEHFVQFYETEAFLL